MNAQTLLMPIDTARALRERDEDRIKVLLEMPPEDREPFINRRELLDRDEWRELLLKVSR